MEKKGKTIIGVLIVIVLLLSAAVIYLFLELKENKKAAQDNNTIQNTTNNQEETLVKTNGFEEYEYTNDFYKTNETKTEIKKEYTLTIGKTQKTVTVVSTANYDKNTEEFYSLTGKTVITVDNKEVLTINLSEDNSNTGEQLYKIGTINNKLAIITKEGTNGGFGTQKLYVVNDDLTSRTFTSTYKEEIVNGITDDEALYIKDGYIYTVETSDFSDSTYKLVKNDLTGNRTEVENIEYKK